MSASENDCRSVCIEREPHPISGFLHLPPAGTSRDTAVLLCAPFGWDDMCSYRGRRSWARALAAAGFAVARIDLPGTGNSGGTPHDAELVAAWVSAVATTATWLRETAAAARVAGAGIGLGGLLACAAMQAGAGIDDLILWAVPARGRALVRELRAHAKLVAALFPEDQQEAAEDGSLELIGYLMSAQTASALASVDLAGAANNGPITNAGRRVLLLGRDGIEPDPALRAYFEGSGADVAIAPGFGYAELMAHPQQTQPPLETIELTRSWLSSGEARSPAPRGGNSESRSLIVRHGGVAVRETPVHFELDGGRAFGILSEPVDVPSQELCAVWLNGGALRHIGPNRTWVEIARRWAARGVRTLRVDHRGIGESDDDDRRLVSDSGLNAPDRLVQTLTILEQLRARGVPPRFVLGGLCSGAYWALHAALADPSVRATMLVNLYAFRWSEALVAERDRRASAQALRGGIIERARSGRLRREHFARGLRSVMPGAAGLRFGSQEDAQAPEFERALDQLRDQQTQVLLLLGHGEPMYDQLVRQGQLGRLDQWPNLTVERIPSRDHIFRALWLQRHVNERLDAALERVLRQDLEGADAA